MPIYKYKCNECEKVSSFMHSFSELQTDCDKCDTKNTLVKVLNRPLIKKNTEAKEDEHVGKLTKQFIEENREVLDKQKREYSERQHDKS